MVAFFYALVDVGEVGAEAGDGFEDRLSLGRGDSLVLRKRNFDMDGSFLPERSIECFDGFGVEVLYSLFVASAYTVVGTGVTVEGVDCLCDAHLGGCHGCVRYY